MKPQQSTRVRARARTHTHTHTHTHIILEGEGEMEKGIYGKITDFFEKALRRTDERLHSFVALFTHVIYVDFSPEIRGCKTLEGGDIPQSEL